MNKHFFIIVFYLSILGISPAQTYFASVQHYSVEDGLSDNYVRHIFQDSKGYIWIPTTSGMNRFDGHGFLHYTHEKNGLTSDDLEQVLEDRNGKLWFVSRGKWNTEGLQYYTKKLDVFDPITERAVPLGEAFQVPFEAKDMKWLVQDHERNIWISTKEGIIFKYDGTRIQRIFRKEVGNDWWGVFAVSTDGMIGINERDSVTVVDTLGNFLFTAPLPYDCNYLFPGFEGALFVISSRSHLEDNGELTVWKLNYRTQCVEPFKFKDKNGDTFKIIRDEIIYTGINIDKQGRFWAFLDESYLLFDEKGEFIYDLTHVLESHDLPAESLYHNFGQDGIVWLSTEKGVVSVDVRENKFQTILDETDYGLAGCIVDDGQGNILISQKDILKLNQNNEIIEHLPFMDITTARRDKVGDIWMADERSGIYFFNPLNKEFHAVAEPKASDSWYRDFLFIRRFVVSMHVMLEQGQILLAYRSGGLASVDIKEGKISPFQKYNAYTNLNELVVEHIYQNEVGIWLATNEGIFLMNEKDGIVAHFQQSKDGVPFNYIYFIHEDEEGIFWLATNGDGLIKWDRKSRTAQQFTRKNGFSHQRIYAVYEDEFGQLWLPSGYGLMQFDKKTNDVLVWLSDDGLPFNEFMAYFHHQSQDGKLFFGGANGGVVGFFPNKPERPNDSLTITQYLEHDNGAGVYIDQSFKLRQQPTLCVPPSVNSLMFKVSLFEYAAPKNIKYAYKIVSNSEVQSYSKDWVYQRDNSIRINNLPYGNHTLEIKAVGADNARAKGHLSLPIFIEKPYYLKPWFISLIATTILSSIYGFSRWRTHKLVQNKKRLEQEVAHRTQTISEQKEELEKINATKDQLFAIIAHDMRNAIYNFRGVTDKIQYFIKRKQPERIDEFGEQINMSVNNLTGLMNNLLDWALTQKGAIPYNPQEIDMKKMADHVFSSFKDMAERKSVSLKTDIPEGVKVYADRNALSTIFRNLVGNSLKYTEQGNIVISSSQSNGTTHIIVSDEGLGMSKSRLEKLFEFDQKKQRRGTAGEKGSGLGLVLVKELVEQNKGSFKIESEEGRGTLVSVSLPASDT